jgi:hypothetical protein
MHKFYYNLLYFLLPFLATAKQNDVYTLTDDDSQLIDNFTVLADKSYSLKQILNDRSLRFVASNDLNVDSSDLYWIKIKVYNPSNYSERYFVEFLPMLDNTLYYFNENQNKWVSYSNGLLVNNGERNIWLMPCVLKGKQTTTLYIKSNIKAFRGSKIVIPATVWLEKENYVDANEKFITLATWATLFAFFIFFIFNAYIFYTFRDKTYLYYFLIQIGGVIYILADQLYFNVLLPFRLCVTNATTTRYVMFHDINAIASDLAICLILFGYVQITRIYLETKHLMPKQDKLVQILFWSFLVCIVIDNFLIFLKITPLKDYRLKITALLSISIVLNIIYIAVLSYYKKFKRARFFLIANAISIIIFLATSLYYIFIGVVRTTDHNLVSKFAIVAHSLCLAIALVQRVLLIREDLKQKQAEIQILQNELEQITTRNKFIQLENKYISEAIIAEKGEKQKLQLKLASNERELAANTLNNIQKNDLLKMLQKQVGQLANQTNLQQKELISEISSTLRSNMILEADWDKFKLHFEKVHPDFFVALREKNPNLTAYEIRLSVYLHLKLSTKEIAMLLNIDPASVRKAKMRLNKKLLSQN